MLIGPGKGAYLAEERALYSSCGISFGPQQPSRSHCEEKGAESGFTPLKQLRQLRDAFEVEAWFVLEEDRLDADKEMAFWRSSGGRGKCPW